MTTDVARKARRASSSDAMNWGAHLGLAARGAIYILMGLLAIGVATGTSRSEADQRGALEAVARHSGGELLLVVLIVGFLAYALWRLSEAAFGVTGEGKGAGPRLKSLLRGLAYVVLAATAFSVLRDAGSTSQAKQQQDFTARVMGHTGGRSLIGVVGVVVIGIGAALVYEGAKATFMKFLRTREMSAATRRTVKRLGMVGTISRGIVFGLAGALVLDAAVTFDPKKARGIDGALRTLAEQPYGKTLLILAAAGLVVFGIYGLAEARWRRT